ncbi:MAG: LLM class flavin-dependent oxidoreductase, partial [Acidimicrobiia bacterium]
YEAAGIDWITYYDQLNLTIPRSIWTPDIVPAAEFWDIDNWMDVWTLMTGSAIVTERITIALTATDALRRPPAVLAQAALSLDHYAKGRFILTLGAGEAKQFAPYGLPRNKPFGHLEESMKIIRLLWESDGPVSYEGPIWSLHNAILGLRPYEGRTPPLMVAGGPGKALELAGRLGDGWMVYLPPCGPPEWYAEQVETVRRHAEKAGRDPEALFFLTAYTGIVEETEDAVDEACNNLALRWDAAALVPNGNTGKRIGLRNPLGEDWSYPRDLVPMDWSREDALRIARLVAPETVRKLRLAGTPPQAAAHIQQYVEAGSNVVLLCNYADLVRTGAWGDELSGTTTCLQVFDLLRGFNGQPEAAALVNS